MFESSEQRLARILIDLSSPRAETQRDSVIGRLDQTALAQMVGTTRARVSYFLNKFKRLGYIDYDGGIRVHRSLAKVLEGEFQLAPPQYPNDLFPA